MKNFIYLILLATIFTNCKKSADQVIEKPVELPDTTTIFTDELSEWVITKSEIDTNISGSQLFFINNTTGFALRIDGNLHKTSDAGKSWKKLTVPTSINLVSIFFVNENIGYIGGISKPNCPEEDCGKGTILLKTTDGGQTWSKHFFKDFDGIFNLTFFNETTGLAVNLVQGGHSHLIRTTDGGISWEKIDLGTNAYIFSSPISITGNAAYVLGEFVPAYKSDDIGKTWTTINNLPTGKLKKIQFLDKDNGITYSKSTLYKTANGGSSWQEINLPSSSDGLSIHFANTTKALGIEPRHVDSPMGLLPAFSGSYSHEIDVKSSNWKKSRLYSTLRIDNWHFPLPTTGFGISGNSFFVIKKKDSQ